jgi:ribosome-binding protein aMBF1 (putative translation factor)
MAGTEIRVFRSSEGECQLIGWLDSLKKKNQAVWKKCLARILDLAREGYRLQRPRAALLRDGIHELRPKSGRINYRILYFFHKEMAILTHGLTKEKEVPNEDIERAIDCRKLIQMDPDKYTAEFHNMATNKDFAKFLAGQIEGDESLADDIERERLNGEIAALIYTERNNAGLTQKELGEKAGTHQSVIARLEDADYNGRNIELMRKVLRALGRRLSVSAEPLVEENAIAHIVPSGPLQVWKPPEPETAAKTIPARRKKS